jgi:dihydro-heme d1 dehydrogenase
MRRRASSVPGAMLAVAALFVASLASAEPAIDSAALYQQHCASCHGADRLGGTGPALFSESLTRLRKPQALKTIADGRAATQMPAFADTLSGEAIGALAEWIYTPLRDNPTWTMDQMRASQAIVTPPEALPERPIHDADPLNLFTVVEAGDQHVTILDGDTFEAIWRFPSHFALHDGAKYSPDGRFVYLGSRDGWVTKHDLYGLTTVAEIRVGLNLRNIAVSGDGRYVIAGNTLPNTAVILDARDLTPLKIIPVEDRQGRPSRVSAVYTAPPRQSFIVALKDQPELREISYRDDPEPLAKGFVHSYRPGMIDGTFESGPFAVRRIELDKPLDDFFFDPAYRNAIGTGRDGGGGQVINLNVGKKIADVPIDGMPHLASGISFDHNGRPVLATPILNDAAIAIIDMTTWQPVARVETGGAGFFMRSHDNTPYAWLDNSMGPSPDQIQIFDKRTLQIVRTLRPEAGRTASHVEFTRDGRYALVSIAEIEGALAVFDARTFAEVKRVPMSKPSGKYNVYNKINLSSGTSH